MCLGCVCLGWVSALHQSATTNFCWTLPASLGVWKKWKQFLYTYKHANTFAPHRSYPESSDRRNRKLDAFSMELHCVVGHSKNDCSTRGPYESHASLLLLRLSVSVSLSLSLSVCFPLCLISDEQMVCVIRAGFSLPSLTTFEELSHLH